jgi:hypothetical protein
VNVVRRTVWVVEAKDEALALSARRIRDEIDGYYRSTASGHQAKLQRKCEDVEKSLDVLAASVGISDCRGWTVEGLFVTRNPSPAEFDERRLFRFTDVAGISEIVSSNDG